MKRVAVLADIHGNLPALEAALADVSRGDPDLIVVCGDVASGPLPVQSLKVLMSLSNARFVRGNADRGLVAAFDGALESGWTGPAADWCAAQLTREQRDFLASFPETLRLDIGGLGRVLFCHGSPRSDEEMMTALTPDSRLREMVAGSDADVIVCGHTHMQFDRIVDGARIVNPGSVGMPYGETGAHWALLGHEIEFRRAAYDLDSAAARIRESSWPEASDFADGNVLSVATVEQAMDFFRSRGGP